MTSLGYPGAASLTAPVALLAPPTECAALAFLTLSQLVQMIAEKTGGDGRSALSALIAAASSGRIVGEGQRRRFITDQPLWEEKEFWPVPAAWWAAIDDPTTLQGSFRVYLVLATNSLINQHVLGFHPGTEYPASQVQRIVRNIRFSQERADGLWPLSSDDQVPPPAPPEPDKQALSFKKAKHSEILPQAQAVLTSVSTWRDKDKDLIPLVRDRLNAVGLDAGRDRIRDAINAILKERQ